MNCVSKNDFIGCIEANGFQKAKLKMNSLKHKNTEEKVQEVLSRPSTMQST